MPWGLLSLIGAGSVFVLSAKFAAKELTHLALAGTALAIAMRR